MTIVANQYTHVVGVDTHAKTHTYAILASATGQVVDTATFPTSPPGIARATDWMNRRSGDGQVLVSVEGASSYGAGLTRTLRGAGISVCDVRPPRRTSRRAHGKSDAIDAVAAAQSVLGIEVASLLEPRADGDRNALRILLDARRMMDRQRSADRLALTAIVRTTELGVDAREALTDAQIRVIAAWRARPRDSRADRVARDEARRLARAVIAFNTEMEANRTHLSDIVQDMAPGLMDLQGLGPVTSAVVLVAYSHHGRIRSEAAFAAIAGVNPIPASSGNTVRHRLNRNGDRQLNKALHTIARTRMQFDAETKQYVERRTAEGKTRKKIRRCLKRAIARQLFRKLQTLMA
ncbi:IS110 family transposase [Paeniglutamicibacter gangotriensis]|uniref:IS110 family transposase n=1 Tax=Paeniglutamicibacter gangotriensis TaxID=254787 RepID=A0A5B0E236_9MICC|nr:IS110 family transposase [Paeniglutamicibacter gangotriensis]KAA0973074.1 IS110 family transposase [Paeniglutamicibacter gangotriensis]